jgi:hypothetical protein
MSLGSNGTNHGTLRDLLVLTLAEGLLDTGVGLLSLNRESLWSSTGAEEHLSYRDKSLAVQVVSMLTSSIMK